MNPVPDDIWEDDTNTMSRNSAERCSGMLTNVAADLNSEDIG